MRAEDYTRFVLPQAVTVQQNEGAWSRTDVAS